MEGPVHSSSASPIYRLPGEILGCIFEAFVFSARGSPWELVLVNREWKGIVMRTSRLWSKILITDSMADGKAHDLGGDVGKIWVRKNFQMCLTMGELDKALSRAGNAILDIRINHCVVEIEVLAAMCARVLGKPISDRLQRLRFDVTGRMEAGLSRITSCLESQYPALTVIELNVPARWSHALLPRLLTAATGTKSIRGRIPHDFVVTEFDWSNLQSLDLRRATPPFVFNRFCHMLQSIHSLEGVPDDWPNNSTPLTTFRELSTMELAVYSSHHLYHLHRLSFPSLRRLDLTISSDNSTAVPALHAQTPAMLWELPSLTQLDLVVYNLPGFAQWLSSVDTPQLQKLHLDVRGQASSDYFPSAVLYPNLRHLYVGADCLGEDDYSRILEMTPNVSIVTISSRDVPRQETNIENLLIRLSENGSRMLCPKMTVMRIQAEEGIGGAHAREVLEPLIERAVESRIGLLESFTVNWPDQTCLEPQRIDYVKGTLQPERYVGLSSCD
ncbi:hypothetical protein FRC17_000552 [Serendipita sp. 399]|nr:hypothetical protein FRC17_000552 [Serendipita sp. 399]